MTQAYKDYFINHEIRILSKQQVFHGFCIRDPLFVFLNVAHIWNPCPPSASTRFFPQIALAIGYRGSYFKYGGVGSQICWIRFGGGCRALLI